MTSAVLLNAVVLRLCLEVENDDDDDHAGDINLMISPEIRNCGVSTLGIQSNKSRLDLKNKTITPKMISYFL